MWGEVHTADASRCGWEEVIIGLAAPCSGGALGAMSTPRGRRRAVRGSCAWVGVPNDGRALSSMSFARPHSPRPVPNSLPRPEVLRRQIEVNGTDQDRARESRFYEMSPACHAARGSWTAHGNYGSGARCAAHRSRYGGAAVASLAPVPIRPALVEC